MIRKLISVRDFKLSEKLIYRLVYQHAGISQNEIAELTGGSISTVHRMVANMVHGKMLLESENAGTRPGRPAYIYRINPESAFAAGAYITWGCYGIGICSIDGRIVCRTENRVIHDETPEDVVTFFTDSLDKMAEDNGIEISNIVGLCVAAPGPLLKKQGILFHTHHLISPNWQVVPIIDMLKIRTNYTVEIDNLVNAALLGELIQGSIPVHQKAAYFLFDRGIGSSTYSAGIALLDFDLSSQLGHMVIDFKGRNCVCGKKGCLETYASSQSIAERLSSFVGSKDEQDELDLNEKDIWKGLPELVHLDVDEITGMGKQARRAVDEITDAIAVAMGNFFTITRPDLVFLGGRTVKQMSVLFEEASRKLVSSHDRRMYKEIVFKESDFSSELLIRGSAFSMLEASFGLTNPVA